MACRWLRGTTTVRVQFMLRKATWCGGFSLIEILVCLAIIGILAKIAIPNLLGLLPTVKLSGAARQLATDLQLVRIQAIARNTAQTVTFDTTAGTYTFGSQSRSVPFLFPGITIASASNLTFTPGGTATNVTITLSNGT